jgi:hypothetical protein
LQIGSTLWAFRRSTMNATITSVGGRAPREIRRRLAKNLVGAPQLPTLELQILRPLSLGRCQARSQQTH